MTKELGSPRNELWLSPLSIWELVLLVEKKRLDLNADMGEWVQQSMRDLDLQEAPSHTNCGLLYWDIVTRVIDFWWLRRSFYDLTLVTADQRLLQIPGLPILANR